LWKDYDRQTSGTVKFEGKIVGSGSGEEVELIKHKKKEYAIELLKLNQYKYDVYLINHKYSSMKKDFQMKIGQLKSEYETQKAKLELPIATYVNDLFEEKNRNEVDLEKFIFDYRIRKTQILNQTKNEYLIEFNSLIKGAEFALKKKLQGIKESAALSKDSKDMYKLSIHESYTQKIEALDNEFKSKIEERSKNLLDKNESKKQLAELKRIFLQEKATLLSSHKKFIQNLKKPNYEEIKAETEVIKKQLDLDVSQVKDQISKLSEQKSSEISKVNSSKVVDKDELLKLKNGYHEFKSQHKGLIDASRKTHFSKEAEKKILKMQMIFQDPISSLNPRMTVQEIVSEGLIINGEKDKKVIKEKVIESLKQVGLAPEYISRYPHEFSGGQRQRIGIARALIMNPSVIIADEPISALDVSIKAQVINLLRDLKDELDLTILFIAHDLSVVKFFCDRIAVMYFGKIVEMASAEELFANPLHGYTQSLLSAIPHPDPDYEKLRKRTSYSSAMHDYSMDKPEFVEITKDHFVSANKAELVQMKKKLGVL